MENKRSDPAMLCSQELICQLNTQKDDFLGGHTLSGEISRTPPSFSFYTLIFYKVLL
jgi:hypothetical protein